MDFLFFFFFVLTEEKSMSVTEKVLYLSCTHTWTVPFCSQKHFYVVAAANRLKRFQSMSVKLP